jgi:ATP synthase protein I
MSTFNKEKNLSKRIDVALAKKDYKQTIKNTDSLNIYYRVGTELLAGLIIGAGIGLTIDKWLNTTPLFLIILFILGGMAGIYNLWRVLTGRGLKMGFFNEKEK